MCKFSIRVTIKNLDRIFQCFIQLQSKIQALFHAWWFFSFFTCSSSFSQHHLPLGLHKARTKKGKTWKPSSVCMQSLSTDRARTKLQIVRTKIWQSKAYVHYIPSPSPPSSISSLRIWYHHHDFYLTYSLTKCAE